jgi:hypothetical protein
MTADRFSISIVTPVSVGVGKREITEPLEKLRPRYGEMLQRLAE